MSLREQNQANNIPSYEVPRLYNPPQAGSPIVSKLWFEKNTGVAGARLISAIFSNACTRDTGHRGGGIDTRHSKKPDPRRQAAPFSPA
jgi:hypothetical protein